MPSPQRPGHPPKPRRPLVSDAKPARKARVDGGTHDRTVAELIGAQHRHRAAEPAFRSTRGTFRTLLPWLGMLQGRYGIERRAYGVFLACMLGWLTSCNNTREGTPSVSAVGEPEASARATADDDPASSTGNNSADAPVPPVTASVGSAIDEPLTCRPTVDGERLQGIRWSGEDGSSETVAHRWYDSLADVECQLMTAADGVRRCLPWSAAPGVATRQLRYVDAQCTRAGVFGQRANCQDIAAKYALIEEFHGDSPADSRFRVYEAGESLGTFETTYLRFGDGACTPEPAPDVPVYRIIGELAPEHFVEVQTLTPVGDRVRDVMRTWSDGATDYVRLHYDREVGATCVPYAMNDTAYRCLPGLGLDSSTYADANCNDLLFVWPFPVVPAGEEVRALGGEKDYFHESSSHSCDVYDHHIYPITEMRDYSELETAYSLSRTEPSMCVAYTPNQGTYLTPGPELDHATLPGAVLAETTCPSRFTAGTRLKGLAQHWDDDALDTISFFDPEFNAKCTLRAAADGAWRCLPEQQTFVSDTYVDAQCTRRAATYRCPPNPADGYDRRDYALDLRQPDPTDRCARELALVYELTGPVVEQTYAKGSDGACTPSGSTRYSRELGAEINAERFVAFSCPDTPAGCFAGVF